MTPTPWCPWSLNVSVPSKSVRPCVCAKPKGPLLAVADLSLPKPGQWRKGDCLPSPPHRPLNIFPSYLAFVTRWSLGLPNSGPGVGFVYVLSKALHIPTVASNQVHRGKRDTKGCYVVTGDPMDPGAGSAARSLRGMGTGRNPTSTWARPISCFPPLSL